MSVCVDGVVQGVEPYSTEDAFLNRIVLHKSACPNITFHDSGGCVDDAAPSNFTNAHRC